MLYRFLNNNKWHHFFLVPLILLAFWLVDLFHSDVPVDQINPQLLMPFYKPFYQITLASPFLSTVISYFLVLINAFFIYQLNNQHNLTRIKGFLPVYLFIFASGGLVGIHYLNPLYIVSIIVMFIIIRLFDTVGHSSSYSNLFDAGFALGIASLFSFSIIFTFPMIWISYRLIHRSMGWRHIVLPLIGLIIPWLFTYTYYYFIDNTSFLSASIHQCLQQPLQSFDFSISYIVFLSIMASFSLLGSIKVISTIDAKTVIHRNLFLVMIGMGILAIIMLLIIPGASKEALLLFANPFAFIFANYLDSFEKTRYPNLFLSIFIAAAIYMQFI